MANILAAGFNPMSGVSPNLGPLGGAFNHDWMLVGGVIWALCIGGVVLYLAKGFLQYSAARQTGYTEKVTEAAKEIKHALAALAGLATMPVIVLGVLGMFHI